MSQHAYDSGSEELKRRVSQLERDKEALQREVSGLKSESWSQRMSTSTNESFIYMAWFTAIAALALAVRAQ